MSYIDDNFPGYDTYVLYVGEQEATEQSAPDDAAAIEPNEEKIELALEMAKSEILGTYCVACPAGKLFIAKMLLPLALDITRYRLDTVKRRDDLKEAYEKACQLLERATSDEICSMEVTAEEAEIFGIPFCPGISFTAAPRVWSREKLSSFRNQSYIRGNERRQDHRKGFTKR